MPVSLPLWPVSASQHAGPYAIKDFFDAVAKNESMIQGAWVFMLENDCESTEVSCSPWGAVGRRRACRVRSQALKEARASLPPAAHCAVRAVRRAVQTCGCSHPRCAAGASWRSRAADAGPRCGTAAPDRFVQAGPKAHAVSPLLKLGQRRLPPPCPAFLFALGTLGCPHSCQGSAHDPRDAPDLPSTPLGPLPCAPQFAQVPGSAYDPKVSGLQFLYDCESPPPSCSRAQGCPSRRCAGRYARTPVERVERGACA